MSITTTPHAIAGPERRLELGRKLHSSLDILQTPTYSRFLKAFFPVFAQLLQQLPLQQQPETSEHKLRWLIVDVLQRLPQNETIKPYINDLLRLALRVITSDNEENALKCMHVFSDVLRTHKPQDPDAAVTFLDFVKGVRLCTLPEHVDVALITAHLVTSACALFSYCRGKFDCVLFGSIFAQYVHACCSCIRSLGQPTSTGLSFCCLAQIRNLSLGIIQAIGLSRSWQSALS